MGLKLDYNVEKIIKKIVEEVKEDIPDITFQEVYNIIDFQFKLLADSIRMGEDISLPMFGSFKIKKGRVDYVNAWRKENGLPIKVLNTKGKNEEPLRVILKYDGSVKNIVNTPENNNSDRVVSKYIRHKVNISAEDLKKDGE